MSSIAQRLVTLSKLGYVPASGTVATIITLPVIVALSWLELDYTLFLGGAIVCGFALLRASLPYFLRNDPHEVVIDEVLGCLVTFWAIPLSINSVLLGVLIFRILDIFKPWIIGYFERLPGAWGVLLDDIAAGVCANLILRLFI